VLAGKHGHQARAWWYENADVDIRADRYLSKKLDGGEITANAMKTCHRLCNLSDGKYLCGYLGE